MHFMAFSVSNFFLYLLSNNGIGMCLLFIWNGSKKKGLSMFV